MSTILFTGFPGFLGSALLPRVLARDPGARAACLVQSKFADLARQRRDELIAANSTLERRIDLVEGDITVPGLGLDDEAGLLEATTQIYHLAAVYDLMVKRPVGIKVNLEGTQNVLDFAADCTALDRLHYVSTCYVSGRYAGIYTEDDLDKGQSFNNYYEETKFLAEVEVQARMQAGLPTTIYRPAVVIGDSKTGTTQKFDGPYFVIRWVLKQGKMAFLPMVGSGDSTRVNLVPSDFIVDAITYLSGIGASEGKVYQLADPSPLTVNELIDLVGRSTGRKVVRVPMIKFAAKAALDYVPGVYRLMQIPSASVDYFVHPTHYTTDNTLADLAEPGIAVPRLESYMDTLVEFVRAHPEIGGAAMT